MTGESERREAETPRARAVVRALGGARDEIRAVFEDAHRRVAVSATRHACRARAMSEAESRARVRGPRNRDADRVGAKPRAGARETSRRELVARRTPPPIADERARG